MTRRAALAAIVLVLGLLPVSAARALPPLGSPIRPGAGKPTKYIGTLDATTPVLTFAGGVTNRTPLPLVNNPVPLACSVTCQSFTFASWTGAPFLVSVKDGTGSQNNGWDLYVYRGRTRLVGAANGIGANGQAVSVDPGVPGAYTVYVTFTYAEDPGAHYSGEVRMKSGPSWQPPAPTCGLTVSGVTGCFELPVLKAAPATDLHVDGLPPAASTPLGFPLPVALPTSRSCYLDEGPTRCLRFTTDVQNVGGGALDMKIPWAVLAGTSATVGFLPGQCHADQALHATTGQVVLRRAGDCVFHIPHAHFHYKDLVGFSLRSLTATGGVGPLVGSSQKASFCLADDDYFGFALTGPNGPRNYVGQPGCNLPDKTGNGLVVSMGVSPGWGDVYTWDTPQQYIDITGVAPGRYDLVEETNPGGTILVGGPQQTCSLTQLDLTATAVKMVSQAQSIPCPA